MVKAIRSILGAILLLAGAEAWAFQLELAPDPNPPETGENELSIIVKDAQGRPVDQAEIFFRASMPPMGTMPYMEELGEVEALGQGRYSVVYELTMGGTWELLIRITHAGTAEEFHYSVTTGIPGIADKNGTAASRNVSDSSHSPRLRLGPDRVQKLGVRYAEAAMRPLEKIVRSVGIVEQDRTHRADVSLRFSGYVVKQFRGRLGDSVKKGEPLFSVYSPELVASQNEFLLAHGFSEKGLHKSAEERLRNLGMSARQIAEIVKSGKPKRDVVISAPISGTILEINAREGGAFGQGQLLYAIGDLSKSYIVGRVFQQDLDEIRVGQRVEIFVPEKGKVHGEVDLIYPELEAGAGTGNVRVVSESTDLRPGLYVDLRFPVDLGQKLTIPKEAVLRSGMHEYVFVDHGDGVLEPREIVTGESAGDWVEVREGLRPGERVAASGTFLLGSEAQLRSALPKWRSMEQSAESHHHHQPEPSPPPAEENPEESDHPPEHAPSEHHHP